MKICLDEMATSLNCRALVVYLFRLVWPNLTVKRGRYLIDHGYKLLGLLSARSAEMDSEAVNGSADMNESYHAFFSLENVPLEKLPSCTSSTSSQEKLINVMNDLMGSVLRPLRNCSETVFEAALKGETA